MRPGVEFFSILSKDRKAREDRETVSGAEFWEKDRACPSELASPLARGQRTPNCCLQVRAGEYYLGYLVGITLAH